MAEVEQLINVAHVLKRDVAEMTTAAGSGHPSSCFSCAEIMAALFFHEMKYNPKDPNNLDNDEFILSKGHAAPILYSSLFRAGCIKDDLKKLRKLTSNLEGHPMPTSSFRKRPSRSSENYNRSSQNSNPHRGLKWVKVATGSLGQGASIGIGMALAAKLHGRKYRTYVLMGDSEMAEGSVYEALQLAPYYNLNNLCIIIDANRLGQSGETMVGHDIQRYVDGIKTFKWHAIAVDGHDIGQLIGAFGVARKVAMPTAIIAKTKKGNGVSFMENKEDWHGKAMNSEELKKALKEIPNVKMPKIKIESPKEIEVSKNKKSRVKTSQYELGGFVSTRMAYGKALANLAVSDPNVIVVDAEVSNSTHSGEVRKVRPGQFIEAFIAEQDMVSICLGLSKKGFNVFGSTFAAFLSRAHDQIKMSALSSGDFTICGSHAGVSIGEDGASQMGLEDIAMFRALPESIVLYPSDGISTEKIVYLAAKTKGLKYIRTTRGKTPVVYNEKEEFKVGDFKVLKQGKKDKVVLVGAGITLHECLQAHEALKKKRINSAVVDLYCVKPFDSKKFIDFVKKHGKKVVVSEDHYEEGGIGEMLAEELENTGIEISHLAVREIPHSGKSKELLEKYGVDKKAIVKAAKKLCVI
ncbi:MAG: transketolase [Nanoarchaeota archaeon]|nr:transketolase [Nanoarchaeota archaeon]MBU1051718.1 transketolase [Nanoarchaeota archaeon]MBU1988934.1 transketolase [Nanoarchaeota archaeon]